MHREATLNFSDADMAHTGELLVQFLRDYERSIPAPHILPPLDRTLLTHLLEEPFPKEGKGVDQLFQDIATQVVPNSTAIAHPRFLAYVQGPPNGIAPFAEAIAATLNQNCNFWQLSPAASVIERKVVSWLASLFHFPKEAGGILTSGGSKATLLALTAAIHDKCPRDFRKYGLQGQGQALVVYTSTEAHRCVEKDAVILGLGQDNIRQIPVDANFGMRLDLLQAAVAEDRAAGKLPFCVVATSGTVNTGAIDPIASISTFCKQENLWLHIDGAFGALFVLSEHAQERLAVCGLADSLTLDPHKLLFAPLEAGCLIVRDPQKLKQAFSFSASYIGAEDDPLLTNYMDYGLQLSRSFKAFKIWCALQTFGVNAFARASNQMLELAQYMAQQIQSNPHFELLAPVNLSAVCFRLRGRTDAQNDTALARLIASGVALLGPVRIHEQSGLRACITNYRTTHADIDLILQTLQAQAVDAAA
jgi:aromatic-L-amino-acid/L-tryptophan decarboxylase